MRLPQEGTKLPPHFAEQPPVDAGLPAVFGCAELARFLLVGIKTVQGLAQRAEIPCRKVGKAYRFYRPAVLQWFLGGRVGRWSKS